MAINYDRFKATAERLIRENGKTAYLLKPGADPDKPWGPEGERTERAVNFVETGYSMTNRNESLVQVGDKMGLISTESGYVPDKTEDKIKIDGETYSFVDVKPLNPGGTTILYEIHARK